MAANARLGIFGGTFDPVHLGHLAAAEEAVYRLGLQRVLFVPARHQPLKSAAPLASDADRLDMLQAATAGNDRFAVSDIELERPGPSYTVETLRALQARETAIDDLYLLLGIDAVNQLSKWREPGEVLRLARVVAMTRGDAGQPDWEALRAIGPDAPARVRVLVVPDVNVSSHELRRRVSSGEPIRYQVPDAAWAIIVERGLYHG